MNHIILKNGELNLTIQLISFFAAMFVTQMAVVEWRRNKNAMYKYLALSFGMLFAQVTVMTIIVVHSYWSGKTGPLAPLHIIDHALITASYIYLVAAFVTLKSTPKSRFIRTNFFVLAVMSPFHILLWEIFGSTPLGPVLKISGDLTFEIWEAGLLIMATLAVLRSSVRLKRGLVTAFVLLLVKDVIYIYNTLTMDQPAPLLLFAEHLVVILFFYTIISTLHKKIIGDLLSMDREKTLITEKAYQDTIRALINSLEAKDLYTRGHSDRVTEHAMVLGSKLGFDLKEITKLYYGAILHDMGKIGISEDILNNPLSLGTDDFDRIKKHPEIGANIISSIESLKNIAPSILYHHERFDGSGYPKGLKGKDIPLHSRIIAICDAFDAMSSTRTYRDSMTREKAVRELVSGAGTQFDPDLVKIFVEFLGYQVIERDSSKSLPA